MPNFPMWACPKPAGLPTSQAQPAFNVLLFQKNWPTYLLRYTMYLDSKESGVNEPSRDSLSHNLRFLHRLWRRAVVPRTRRPHLTAVRARATPATAARSPRRAALLGQLTYAQ